MLSAACLTATRWKRKRCLLETKRGAENTFSSAQRREIGEFVHLLLQQVVQGYLPEPAGNLGRGGRQASTQLGRDLEEKDIGSLGVDNQLAQRRVGAEASVPIPLAFDLDGMMEQWEKAQPSILASRRCDQKA